MFALLALLMNQREVRLCMFRFMWAEGFASEQSTVKLLLVPALWQWPLEARTLGSGKLVVYSPSPIKQLRVI